MTSKDDEARELADLEEEKTEKVLVGILGGMVTKKRVRKCRNLWMSSE